MRARSLDSFKNAIYCFFLVGALSFMMTMDVAAASSSSSYYHNFWNPTYHGERLSYCLINKTSCGAMVAEKFCRLMGYERANAYLIANNIGLSNYLDTQAQCVGWQCNGFKLIRCVGQFSEKPIKNYAYRYRRFTLPRYGQYRVAWCYDDKQGCGEKAAQSFCKRLGYMKTTAFHVDTGIDATKSLANQKLCFGSSCQGFKDIVCYR